MTKNLSSGQAYALISFAITGLLLCIIGVLDTVVVVATGHDSPTILVILRFVVGLFGLSGTGSVFAVVKHINDVNGGDST